ncbi:hypothetical protein F5J12DRAFT_783695 [Pisolithus orientalis]|uniref:uncharacterized protein n=1 Tax=Pisolithus orientalis TaxID=936130 RepID=UPI0022241A43|nr:uncharacterized protein F5J12DRAFT_783695 [Pisolithus orientalis]KAI6003269.1 hypothetical protein F5J12DRAFT_783695 [Pisolithus orientalis]
MLKHSGQGHDPAGVLNTKEGKCAVLCPACPQPRKNMMGSPERDVDALFVTLDTNFCLRHHAVSNNENNPSLSQGWAYFVEDTMFKRYLSDHWHDIQEKSMCSNHNAVNMADAKSKKGCNVTGIGMVVCTRYGMRLPNGIVDLQYGERYVNMDYAFASALHHSDVTVLKVSYDIACQWHKKLYQWMDQMPPSLQSNLHDWAVTFLVPKFHLPAHIASCQWSFSFNWTKGVGQTDGKEPEHGWANLNPTASSMKTMGPSHRQDTLDDYFGDWNWKKLIGLGASLLRKVKEAIPECNDHQCDFEELTWLLKLKFPEQLALWKQQVEDWEANSTKPNPFEVKNNGITQARGSELLLHPDATPSVLIGTGIDLEDQQQHLCDATELALCVMDMHKLRVQQQSNALVRLIEAWQKLQVLFMPGVSALWDEWLEFASQPHSLEDVPLFLPSQCIKHYPFLPPWLDKLGGGTSFTHLQMRTLVHSQMLTTSGLERDGAMFLGFGSYTGTVITPQRRNQMMVFRRPSMWSGAKHVHVHTAGKRRLGYYLKKSNVHYSFLSGMQIGGWAMLVPLQQVTKLSPNGCHAYAECQAELQHQLTRSFADMWKDTQHFLDVANAYSVSPSPML